MRMLVLFCGLNLLDIHSCFSSEKVIPADITQEDLSQFIEILEKEDSIKESIKIPSLASLAQKIEELIDGDVEDLQKIKSTLEMEVDRLGETSMIVKNEREMLLALTENHVQKTVLSKKNSSGVVSTDVNNLDAVTSEEIVSLQLEDEIANPIEEFQKTAEALKTRTEKFVEVSSSGLASIMSMMLGEKDFEEIKTDVQETLEITKEIIGKIEKDKKTTTGISEIINSMTSEKTKLEAKKTKLQETLKSLTGWSVFVAKGKLTSLIGDIDTILKVLDGQNLLKVD